MGADHYFYKRAEAELKMAQRARSPEAVRVHYELANRYLDRFYNPGAYGEAVIMPMPRSE